MSSGVSKGRKQNDKGKHCYIHSQEIERNAATYYRTYRIRKVFIVTKVVSPLERKRKEHWRHFGAEYTNMHADYTGKGVDQLAQCIHKIKNNPTDRRIILSAWNPAAIPEMALHRSPLRRPQPHSPRCRLDQLPRALKVLRGRRCRC